MQEEMESSLDDNIALLLTMGFSDVTEIRQALHASRNDVSEAVSYLTHERPLPPSARTPPSVEISEGLGLGGDATDSRALVPIGPMLPVKQDFDGGRGGSAGVTGGAGGAGGEGASAMMESGEGEEDGGGFPGSYLYELESRVFTSQWSIPFKRDEALGRCLLAAIRMVKQDTFESEELWRRFVEQCLPEAFRKLFTSIAVRSWRPDVQEGVLQMSHLLIELVVELLKHDSSCAHPVMAQVLSLVFDPDNEWHQKNRGKESDRQQWEMSFGEGCSYAVSPEGKEPMGWLVDLVNTFGEMRGLELVAKSFSSIPSPNLVAMASMLLPVGCCAPVLNPAVVAQTLEPCAKAARDLLEGMTEKQLRAEPLRAVSDLMTSVTGLSMVLWPDETQGLADLRLGLILRMLKTPSFNVRMHALKEVTRLIEESESNASRRSAVVNPSLVLEWMTQNQILSMALEGNMDHPQYSERVRGLVEFLGPRLSATELSRIWALQDGHDSLLVDNVHAILVAAAPKLPQKELEHLFGLVQRRWEMGNERVRERLLVFMGRIGREGGRTIAASTRAATRVMELLWELAHGPCLGHSLACKAMEELLNTLVECSNKDQMCRLYMGKCVDDIQKGTNVYPSLMHLHNMVKCLAKGSGVHKPDKSLLYELSRKCEMMQLVTSSLSRCHQKSVHAALAHGQPLTLQTQLDGGLTHGVLMSGHLDFIQFLLKEVEMYLIWGHCEELWDTLIANPHACEADREACFRWLGQCLPDLQTETQHQLFTEKLLRLEPASLSLQGFYCFRNFFEVVNTSDTRFRRISQQITVERQDPIGLDMVWSLLLESPSEAIAQHAVDLLMSQVLRHMNARSNLKIINQHQKFISECDRRLKASLCQVGDTVVTTAVTSATKTLTAVVNSSSLSSPTRTSCMQHVNRLLMLAQNYVTAAEESFSGNRTLPPHGTTFRGRPVRLHLLLEPPGSELWIDCHGTETVKSVKQRIMNELVLTPDHLQFYWYTGGSGSGGVGIQPGGRCEQLLEPSEDLKMLNQLGCQEEIGWIVRNTPTIVATGVHVQEENWDEESTTVSGGRQSGNLEQEKQLPGVIMATTSSLFDLLFHLASLGDARVTASVRQLLHLLPTDSTVMEAIEVVLFPPSRSSPSTPSASPQKGRSPSKPVKPPPPDPDALRHLFDASSSSSEGTSSFRVLYNLEVLSGKLLPVEEGGSNDEHIRCWVAFIQAGGLHVLLSLLGGDALPIEGAADLRQLCCLIALQLLRHLLVGDATQPPLNLDKLEDPNLASRIVNCLVRVAWAAAAGHLQLASVSTPQRDSPLLSMSSVRQSSTGSSASSGSESEANFLHAGVCAQQRHLSSEDSLLARLALELLGTWLQKRPDLITIFLSLTTLRDFLVDTVLGSACVKVRGTAGRMLQDLSKISLEDVNGPIMDGSVRRCGSIPPRLFLLQVLLKAPVPLWVTSPTARGTTQRLIGQCEEYFNLLAGLLEGLSETEQNVGQVELSRLLDDEQSWLANFSPGPGGDPLLRGHLMLTRSLMTCEGASKDKLGPPLISSLLSTFLFPASQTSSPSEAPLHLPKCDSLLTRGAAYDLLVEMTRGSAANVALLCGQLITMHHQYSPELAREFEFEPQLESRAMCGYVGLKNAGATCYMNSILQHLFMVPGVKESILAVPDETVDEGSLFYQMQMIMGHLMESRLQFYVPEQFWHSLRLKGRPVNVREQQDAFEFFTHLVDEVDEYLAKNGCNKVFQPRFQGIFLDQKICRDCPHRYTHEESFLALNLTVKSHVLEESLAQFVKEELLEGDNAYFCEKCGCKRTAVKHLSLKSLPPTLVIQLKRFHYDWEAGRSLKFDDYFQFPWELDLGRYTVDGTGSNYELVGVVVHSGQASAGHYYSFIKERRCESLCLPNKGKWFKFNDTTVEECQMDDAMLEAECFGGTYRAKVTPTGVGCSLPEERQRYWNAYMLLYERCETVHTPRRGTAGRSKSFRGNSNASPRPPGRRGDSLSQLSALLCQGERQGLFSEPVTSQRVAQAVQEANLRFMRGRDVFCPGYCQFVKELCCTCLQQSQETQTQYSDGVVTHAAELGAHFLLNTYCHTKLCNSVEMEDWLRIMEAAVKGSQPACCWVLGYLSGEEGQHHLRPFLLECPLAEVRMHFAQLLEGVLRAFFQHGMNVGDPNLDLLIDHLLHLLEFDVPESWRTAGQFFSLLLTYAQLGIAQCGHLLQKGAFRRLLTFLLGPRILDTTHPTPSRRWTSLQLRDFADVHRIMAALVLACDLTPLYTCSADGVLPRQPCTCRLQEDMALLQLPSDVEAVLRGSLAPLFAVEGVRACRELGPSVVVVTDMLVQASFCSERFSSVLLTECLVQYANVPSHELRHLSSLLLEFLILQDPLQEWRLQIALEGCDSGSNHVAGLLALLRSHHSNDSRRAYQCLKLLVALAGRSAAAKELLLRATARWQWAVRWLQQRMAEHSPWSSNESTPAAPSQSSGGGGGGGGSGARGDADTTSNEEGGVGRGFQRTTSAQVTLEEAAALLTESQTTAMDIDVEDLGETEEVGPS